MHLQDPSFFAILNANFDNFEESVHTFSQKDDKSVCDWKNLFLCGIWCGSNDRRRKEAIEYL